MDVIDAKGLDRAMASIEGDMKDININQAQVINSQATTFISYKILYHLTLILA